MFDQTHVRSFLEHVARIGSPPDPLAALGRASSRTRARSRQSTASSTVSPSPTRSFARSSRSADHASTTTVGRDLVRRRDTLMLGPAAGDRTRGRRDGRARSTTAARVALPRRSSRIGARQRDDRACFLRASRCSSPPIAWSAGTPAASPGRADIEFRRPRT